MCDYSLHHVAARPAEVGDKIVTGHFPGTITRGFAAREDCNTAVCLKVGAEIGFLEPPRFYEPVTWFVKTAPAAVAVFTQVETDNANAHHDALEFPDGTVIKVHQLCEGQHAHVLQLPAFAQGATAGEPAEPRPLTPEQESLVLAAVGDALARPLIAAPNH